MKALPLILLAAFLTFGLSFCLGASIYSDNWNGMYVLIPVLVGILCLYGFLNSNDPSSDSMIVSSDGWIFLLSISFTSCLGLFTIFYHLNTISGTSYYLNITGVVLILIGVLVYLSMDNTSE